MNIFVGILIAILFVIVLSALVSYVTSVRKIKKYLDNYQIHSSAGSFLVSSGDAAYPIAKSINKLLGTLREKYFELQDEATQFKVLINSMHDGIAVIDVKEDIILANPAFQKIFDVESVEGKTLLEATRNHRLHDIVQDTFEQRQNLDDIVELIANSRHLFVHSTLVQMTQDDEVVILLVSDITKLKNLESIRSEFVSNISHELKTPLTSIMGYAEILASMPEFEGGDARNYLEKIVKGSVVLKTLIDEILKLSSIESGQIIIDKKDIQVAELMEACLVELEGKIRDKKMVVEKNFSPNLKVNSDPKWLQQVFKNVIDNCIKYGGKKVAIAGIAKDGYAEIEISDDGMGISDSDLPRIFERFFRADRAHSGNVEGTGLGLAIVKHLLEALGGKISVESQVGKGSKFTITLYC